MRHGDFIWGDLSTFNLAQARKDYAALFGWSFAGENSYKYALNNNTPAAAIFKMPRRLIDIGMPSFWMSYIAVDDLEAALKKARSHNGVIVEIERQAFSKEAQIALVRDPSGAGFTLYEGPEIAAHGSDNAVNFIAARYHHLADISVIENFYKDLFGWSFHKVGAKPWPLYEIRSVDHRRLAWAEAAPEDVRGKFCYWMPSFLVASMEEFLATLKKRSGALFFELSDGRRLVADRQGAHFMVQAIAR